MSIPLIRAGRLEDAEHLPAIERAAGALFRTIPDLAWIADHDVLEGDDHHDAMMDPDQGHWVAVVDDELAGFLVSDHLGDDVHIREISVDPRFQRRGIARALMGAAFAHGRERGASRATLTTFRDVPWNEPLYHRLGFVTLTEAQLDAHLRAVLDHEAELGLPRERRCAMARPIEPDPSV